MSASPQASMDCDEVRVNAGAFADSEVDGDDEWIVMRVGGDMEVEVTHVNGMWRFGASRIDTALPEGYPPPTPPGAIELKKYPEVRRAEVTSRLNPGLGMNLAFFPLFQHIQRREIAMTSPVEMDYHDWDGSPGLVGEWTMSFLYRTPDLGPVGEDGRVKVRDVAPMTVLSIGMNGSYSLSNIVAGIDILNAWLNVQDEWVKAGDRRAFYYNDPSMPNDRKWLEVQVPVECAGE